MGCFKNIYLLPARGGAPASAPKPEGFKTPLTIEQT